MFMMDRKNALLRHVFLKEKSSVHCIFQEMSRLASGVQSQSNDSIVAAKDDSIILIIYSLLFCCLLEANVQYRCP